MSKILVTGGAGYIGSHVANLLIDQGYDLTIIDSLITGNKTLINPKAKFINCDIADSQYISEILINKKFDIGIWQHHGADVAAVQNCAAAMWGLRGKLALQTQERGANGGYGGHNGCHLSDMLTAY